MAERLKLTVAYLGTSFAGWQRQTGAATIQGELEGALTRVTGGLEAAMVGAGRTDAGVHARGQVAHVDLPAAIPPDDLVRALNGALPDGITVLRARAVARSFHARFSARGKRYVYRAHWGGPRLPWRELRSARIRPPVYRAAFAEAVGRLQGRRDWASFTVPDPDQVRTLRTVSSVRLRLDRHGLAVVVEGEGFLRYQVRRMVGAALEVAWGRRSPADLERLLAEPRPGSPLYTAPARGLTLEKVLYRQAPVLDSVPQE